MNRQGLVGSGGLTYVMQTLRSWLPSDGLVVSSALAHGPIDLLTANLPNLRHLRFLPEIGPLVTDCGRPELRSDATAGTAVFLGAEDRDLQGCSSAFSLGLSHSPRDRARKERRLDSLFGPCVSAYAQVDALFVAERSARVLAILQGGDGLLDACRPWLVLPLDHSPSARRIIELLKKRRYRLFDQALLALDPPPDGAIDGAATWVLAIPAERATAPAWRPARKPAPRRGGTGLAAAAREGGSTTSRMIPIDTELACWGFHAPEGDAGSGWTWVGPRPHAGLLIPATDGALTSVLLHVSGTMSPRNLAEAVVSLDGFPAQIHCDAHGSNKASLVVGAPAWLPWQPFHRLEMSFPVSVRHGQDSRHLAVALAAITVHCSGR